MLLFLRYFIVAIYILIIALLGQILSLLRPFNPSNLYPFARMIGWGTKILGIRFKLFGNENIQNDKTAVYISNHQHNIDIFICSQFIPKRTVSIGKKSLLYIPIFGSFYVLLGNILINRQKKAKAFQSLDKANIALTRKKTSIWIMPEGTRSQGKGLLPFKKGPFIMAIRAQVPIVPISISSYHKFLNLKKLNSGIVLAKIHPPISTIGLQEKDRDTLMLQCHKIIKEGIEELDHKIKMESR